MKLNRVERGILLRLLDDYAERLGTDGCNDIEIPNTSDGRELFIKSLPNEGLIAEFWEPKNKRLIANNMDLLSFLRRKLERII